MNMIKKFFYRKFVLGWDPNEISEIDWIPKEIGGKEFDHRKFTSLVFPAEPSNEKLLFVFLRTLFEAGHLRSHDFVISLSKNLHGDRQWIFYQCLEITLRKFILYLTTESKTSTESDMFFTRLIFKLNYRVTAQDAYLISSKLLASVQAMYSHNLKENSVSDSSSLIAEQENKESKTDNPLSHNDKNGAHLVQGNEQVGINVGELEPQNSSVRQPEYEEVKVKSDTENQLPMKPVDDQNFGEVDRSILENEPKIPLVEKWIEKDKREKGVKNFLIWSAMPEILGFINPEIKIRYYKKHGEFFGLIIKGNPYQNLKDAKEKGTSHLLIADMRKFLDDFEKTCKIKEDERKLQQILKLEKLKNASKKQP
jgi:hypothetical protein